MRKILITAVLLSMTACASPPQFLANYYDRNDPCQTGGDDPARRKMLDRSEGYQIPSWCGASNNRNYVYSRGGTPLVYLVK